MISESSIKKTVDAGVASTWLMRHSLSYDMLKTARHARDVLSLSVPVSLSDLWIRDSRLSSIKSRGCGGHRANRCRASDAEPMTSA